MSGAAPARAGDDSVLVERHLFALVDVDGGDPPWPGGEVPAGEAVWLLPNRVDFRSPGEDHVAAVRFESWDTEPGHCSGGRVTSSAEVTQEPAGSPSHSASKVKARG
ncbi:hypothetical protein [Actinoplanes sp. RD1]|uniref:hypothetical protein n=1 Tax=Actinoplanes sp. RD1 TaxID=3064538 RepID=UPI0027412DAD|nr:hypothetical protein [Actinoplanes sp. RD1]